MKCCTSESVIIYEKKCLGLFSDVHSNGWRRSDNDDLPSDQRRGRQRQPPDLQPAGIQTCCQVTS